MVVLADFDIDTVALAMESQALSDDENGIQVGRRHVCIDVSRYYLYDWGFLCHDFYSSSTPLDVSGPVLAAHHVDTSTRFADLLASAAIANDHFQSPPNKELYRVVSKQWKDISAPDKAKFKTKMDRAMAKMQQELPTLSALYQPLPKNSTKPPPHDAKKLDEPASPTSLKVATVQDQVDALVALMERRFKVKLV
ncbi:hypothetical protein DYB31_014131 [Aphanomyces astaci]|uniref:Uncharacterized protein n=1 Tax=Aphanomyces astaci TaxID=112090 RepID=A0A397FL32_APHAT|nr:hypothetical protein DYB31_014131 [Aphanomyces astaci]